MSTKRQLWKHVPLPEYVFYQEGPGLRNWQWTESGMKVINVTNIIGDGTVDTSNTNKYISHDEFHKKYRHFEVNNGDIVVASSGNTYGKYGRISSKDLPLMMNTSVIRFRSKDPEVLDNDYLYMFVRSRFFKDQVEACVTGSAQPNFGPSHVKRMYVLMTDIQSQIRLAKIIGAYDKLIENNLRRIQLLEEAATSHYRLLMEKTKENYSWTGISSLCSIQGGGTPSTKVPSYWQNEDVIWFTPTDLTKSSAIVQLDSEKKISEIGLKNSSAKLFPPRTIMMTSRASIGFFGVVNKPAATNQGFINILPFEEHYRYFLLFNLRDRKEELIGIATGATFLEVSKTNFRSLKVKLPQNTNLLIEFEDRIQNLLNLEENLLKQNVLLTNARDILLPRLMSGEIDVSSVSIPKVESLEMA